MDLKTRVRAWINENAPMLKQVYQNKYVEMAYDRFASYPPAQQRQFVYGGFFAILLIVCAILFSNFWGLWELRSTVESTKEATYTLLEYKKRSEEKRAELRSLEQNSLSDSEGLKKWISEQARMAAISQRFVQVEEVPTEKKDSRTAKIKLQRVNLTQLKSFLQQVEFSNSGLGVNSVRITADDKVKGYLNAEIGVSLAIFKMEEEG